jgi:23S rRNA (cytosine1962-C5)-methyltransferase
MPDPTPFLNRLTKNLRHCSKWARRHGIECFRIYDRDLPEFPLAIDVYAGRPHVQAYETRWEADETTYDAWVVAVRETVAELFAIAPQALAFKVRRRQKGTAQYEPTGSPPAPFVVQEGGLKFEVDLHRYLDTGLFLDHRRTRAMVRDQAKDKRFLNLFAYTGSFTVYAAAGGAETSLTLDLSNTYQDWTRRNLRLNGLDLPQHRLERCDVMDWLEDSPRLGLRFDLIVLDPPSFSQSKAMQTTLDVQRDHPWMVNRALGLLSPEGVLYFSNNRRGFRLYEDELIPCRVEEITKQTVPEDFGRHRPHRCWVIRRGS